MQSMKLFVACVLGDFSLLVVAATSWKLNCSNHVSRKQFLLSLVMQPKNHIVPHSLTCPFTPLKNPSPTSSKPQSINRTKPKKTKTQPPTKPKKLN